MLPVLLSLGILYLLALGAGRISAALGIPRVTGYLAVVNRRNELVGVIKYADIADTLFEPGLRHIVVAGDITTPVTLKLTPDDTICGQLFFSKAAHLGVYAWIGMVLGGHCKKLLRACKETVDKAADFFKMPVHRYQFSAGFHCLCGNPDIVGRNGRSLLFELQGDS